MDGNIDWFKWRPIVNQIVTLEEVERYWTICDLADAHEALDIKNEAEAFYHHHSRKGKK